MFLDTCEIDDGTVNPVPPSPIHNALLYLQQPSEEDQYDSSNPSNSQQVAPPLPDVPWVEIHDGIPVKQLGTMYNFYQGEASKDYYMARQEKQQSQHRLMLFIIIGVIIALIIGVIILCTKSHKLATILGLYKAAPTTAAATIQATPAPLTLPISILMYGALAAIALLIAYLTYKNFKTLMNLYRAGMNWLSCPKFMPDERNYIYLRVASINKSTTLPAGYITNTEATFLVPKDLKNCKLTLHTSLCSAHVTTQPANLYLICNNSIFHLPASYPLRCHQVHKMREILATDYSVSALVGNHEVYRQFKLLDVKQTREKDILPENTTPATPLNPPSAPTHDIIDTQPTRAQENPQTRPPTLMIQEI